MEFFDLPFFLSFFFFKLDFPLRQCTRSSISRVGKLGPEISDQFTHALSYLAANTLATSVTVCLFSFGSLCSATYFVEDLLSEENIKKIRDDVRMWVYVHYLIR